MAHRTGRRPALPEGPDGSVASPHDLTDPPPVRSALYFIRVVGPSATEVGAGLTLGRAAGAVAGVPPAHLADRRGARGTAVALVPATGPAVAVFLTVGGFPARTAAAVFHACCRCGLGTARQALLAALVPERERTRVRAYPQSTGDAGLAVGAAPGGLALHLDTPAAYRTVLAVDALALVVAALVLSRLPAVPPAPVGAPGTPRLTVLRDRRYVLVTALHTVLPLYMPLLGVIVPLWTVQRTEAPHRAAALRRPRAREHGSGNRPGAELFER